jgi:nicotinamidase-related amidase
MELLDAQRSLLLVIDMQGKLMEMVHRHGMIRAAAVRLLRLAGMHRVPVLLTEQYAKGLGGTHPEIRAAYDECPSEKRYLDKTSFGCGGDPKFLPLLRELRPGLEPKDAQIVVTGIEAHICVLQTVTVLRQWGYVPYLCWDAVSARGEEYYRHALDRMAHDGAVITNHESVGFEWARDKNHACFKPMSNLFKEPLVP